MHKLAEGAATHQCLTRNCHKIEILPRGGQIVGEGALGTRTRRSPECGRRMSLGCDVAPRAAFVRFARGWAWTVGMGETLLAISFCRALLRCSCDV